MSKRRRAPETDEGDSCAGELQPRQYVCVAGTRYVTPYDASSNHWPKTNYVGMRLHSALAAMLSSEHRSEEEWADEISAGRVSLAMRCLGDAEAVCTTSMWNGL
jgi:hypothetical protein